MTRSDTHEGVAYARDYHKKVRFAAHLGIEQVALEPGVARMRCALQPHMTNSWGIELATAFIDAGKGTLQSEARVLRNGRSLIFVEGEVRNEDGTLVAKAQGTVRARQAKAAE
jgi:acyl-coenzyme A thioesterase PaaI-like protein